MDHLNKPAIHQIQNEKINNFSKTKISATYAYVPLILLRLDG